MHCRPVHFVYSRTSENGPTERTVLHLMPYIYYSSSGAQKFLENHTKWEWLNGVSWNMYKDLCNVNNMPEFTGYCTYRKDVRSFNALRILEGFAYDCYKPLGYYDTKDVLEVLEKGDGKLAEIIYLHFPEEKKKKHYNVANYGHALVMQGKIDEAIEAYRVYPNDKYLPNGQSWSEAIIKDIDSYIINGIHREEFEQVKKVFEHQAHKC